MSNTSDKQRRFGTFWVCPNCTENPEFEHKPMMEHLQQVHGIDPETAKGTKRTLMHLDGDTWFSWDYEWEIAGLKFLQHSCQERDSESRAMWTGDE